MKKVEILFSKEAIQKALKTIGPAINPNAIVLATSHVLVTVKGKSAVFMGTDFRTTIMSKVEILPADEDITFCLPFSSVNRLINALPDSPITVEYSYNENWKNIPDCPFIVTIKCPSGEYIFDTIAPDEFPSPPKPAFTHFKANGVTLAEAIELCVVTCDPLSPSPLLTGVHFVVKDKKFTVCSFLHQASTIVSVDGEYDGDVNFSLEKSSCDIIKGVVKGKESVVLYLSSQNVAIKDGDNSYIFTLIDLQNKVDPNMAMTRVKETSVTCRIEDVEELVACINRAMIAGFGTKTTSSVTVKEQIMIIETYDSEGVLMNTQSINCESDGVQTFGMLCAKLKPVLSSFSGPVEFLFSEETAPYLMKSDERPGVTLVIAKFHAAR